VHLPGALEMPPVALLHHAEMLYLPPLVSATAQAHRQHRHCAAARQGRCGEVKDLDRWGYLLRYISDRIAPVIGPPGTAQALPAAGNLLDLGLNSTADFDGGLDQGFELRAPRGQPHDWAP